MPAPGRRATIVIVLAALVVAAGFTWLSSSTHRRTASPGMTAVLDDAMFDLQIVPLDHRAKPFTLTALDGTRVGLADLEGHPALLYFWASW